jgi:DNA-binding transcriptional ArsR family regulator
LRREIVDLGFVYRRAVPEFLAPWLATPGYRTFEAELADLRELDDTTVALGFLRPLWDHEGRRDAALLEDEAVRRHAAQRAEQDGADPVAARLVFESPNELLERFAALLDSYWNAAFAEEWQRLEPRLAETVADAGRRIAADDVYRYLTGLSPQLLIDPTTREISRNVPHEHTIEITPERELVLVPSAYVWPHVRVNCDAPWPPTIVYPAPFALADARPGVPSDEVVHVLKALADETRLRSLKLIAGQPRSTQELAPLVGISQAGLSKHLRLLARAGLVQTKREGYYVLYSVDRDRIAPLSEALLDFLAT